MIEEYKLAVFKESILQLLATTNLRISYDMFFWTYKKYRDYHSQITLSHQHLGVALDRRNHLPGTLVMDQDILSKLSGWIIIKQL